MFNTPEEVKPHEPRPLSTEYHKARKQLMLWAAILFIWELVGIDLEKAKEAGGNAGAIIGSLKSPQAVPWALLVLVIYFGFKLRIEWGQCNQARRQVRESRLDYYSAFAVAGAACALYFGQAISHMQFANAIQGSSRLSSVMAGAIVPFGIGGCVYFLREWYQKRHKELIFFAGFFLALFSFLMPISLRREAAFVWPLVALAFGLGSIGSSLFFVMLARIRRLGTKRN